MMWFILNNEEVSGPFRHDYVAENCDENSLVWGPGLDEWSPKRVWRDLLKSNPNIQKEAVSIVPHQPQTSPSPSTSPEAETKAVNHTAAPTQKAIKEAPSIKWYYACNNEKFGPFAEPELVEMLKMLNFSSQVYLWNKSLENWTRLEAFPEIISQVTEFAA